MPNETCPLKTLLHSWHDLQLLQYGRWLLRLVSVFLNTLYLARLRFIDCNNSKEESHIYTAK